LYSVAEDAFVDVLKELVSLGSKKSYLSEACFDIICHIVLEAPDNLLEPVKRELLPLVKKVSIDQLTPDLLALGICLEHRLSIRLGEGGKHHLLHKSNLSQLAPMLAETKTVYPRVHSMWTHIQMDLKSSSKRLRSFWGDVVDSTFATSAVELRYLAISLAIALIPNMQPTEVRFFFLFSFFVKTFYKHQVTHTIHAHTQH
jgi:hypothetical protein